MRRAGRGLLAVGVSAAAGLVVLVGLGLYYRAPPAPVGDIVWSARLGTGLPQVTEERWAVRAGDGLVLAVGGGTVTAIDPGDAAQLWSVGVEGAHGHMSAESVVILDDRVIVGENAGVIAISRRDGDVLWRHEEQGRAVFAVDASHEVVAVHVTWARQEVPSGEPWTEVVGLDPHDGSERWRIPVADGHWLTGLATSGGEVRLTSSWSEEDRDAEPDEYGDRPWRDFVEVAAVDAADGRDLWRRVEEGFTELVGSGGTLVRSEDRKIVGRRPQDGVPLWSYRTGPGWLHDLLVPDDELLVAVWDDPGDAPGWSAAVLDAVDGSVVARLEHLDGWIEHAALDGEIAVVVVGGTDVQHLEAFDLGGQERLWTAPLDVSSDVLVGVAGDTVVVSTGSVLRGLERRDGTVRWTMTLGIFRRGDHTPVVVDGGVYVAGHDGLLRAFDPEDGTVLWRERLGALGYSQPAVHEGRVYAVTGLGSVRAFHARSGKPLWRTPSVSALTQALRPVPAGDAVVAAVGARVWAVDSRHAQERWAVVLDAEVAGMAPAGTHVVVALRDGGVRSLAVIDGEERWSVTTGLPAVGPPLVAQGLAVVVLGDGSIHALDEEGGDTRWSRALGVVQQVVASPDGRALYAVGGDVLVVLDATTGDERARHVLPTHTAPLPAAADDAVYAVAGGGAVFEVHPISGRTRTVVEPGTPVRAIGLGERDLVYVVTEDGMLLAVR